MIPFEGHLSEWVHMWRLGSRHWNHHHRNILVNSAREKVRHHLGLWLHHYLGVLHRLHHLHRHPLHVLGALVLLIPDEFVMLLLVLMHVNKPAKLVV